MNKEQILARKSEIESNFSTLNTQKNQLTQQITDINTEQLRLQGEFRLLEKMEKELEPEAVAEVASEDK